MEMKLRTLDFFEKKSDKYEVKENES